MNPPVVEVPMSDGSISRVPIANGETLIVGRGPNSHIKIDEMSVSTEHARLANRPGGVIVVDCDSTNGTLVNGRRIDTEWRLKDRDVLSFGGFTVLFRDSRLSGELDEPIPQSIVGREDDSPSLQFEEPIQNLDDPGPARELRGFAQREADSIRRAGDLTPDPVTEVTPGTANPTVRRPGGLRVQGIVTRVRIPEANGNPIFSMEVSTPNGDTFDVRRSFAFPFGVPHVSEGHHVDVEGDLKQSGLLVPMRIKNETTGVLWQSRRKRWIVALIVLAVLALLVMVAILVGLGTLARAIFDVPTATGLLSILASPVHPRLGRYRGPS